MIGSPSLKRTGNAPENKLHCAPSAKQNMFRPNLSYMKLDPSGLFEGTPDTYFDVYHYTKIGNALLGKYIHDAVTQNARGRR